MIHVIATIEVKSGQRDTFLVEFRKVEPLVRAEVGCIEYGAGVDAATELSVQVGPRPDVVTVVEKWESVEHLKRHLAEPHMAAFRAAIGGIFSSMSLVVLSPV